MLEFSINVIIGAFILIWCGILPILGLILSASIANEWLQGLGLLEKIREKRKNKTEKEKTTKIKD